MKAKFETIKADMYHVFVQGNANEVQLAKAYFLLAIPALTLLFAFGNFKY